MKQRIRGFINLAIGWMELNRASLLVMLALLIVLALSMVYVHMAHEYYMMGLPRWHGPP